MQQSVILTARVAGRMLRESIERRGIVGSVLYGLRNCTRIAKWLRFWVREDTFDHRLAVETSRQVRPSDLGVDIEQLQGVAVSPRGFSHGPTPAGVLTRILKDLTIPYEDYVFIDFGSGMGRAVLMAAEFPFRRVVGVEFAPALHAAAEQNLAHSPIARRRAMSVELVCGDATEYPVPPGKSILYLFNPFNEAGMRKFLANLELRQRSVAGDFCLIYLNPVCGHLLDNQAFLSRIKTFSDSLVPDELKLRCSVYRSC